MHIDASRLHCPRHYCPIVSNILHSLKSQIKPADYDIAAEQMSAAKRITAASEEETKL